MKNTQQRGAAFLFQPVMLADLFTPEALTAEQRAIARTARDFATREAHPQRAALARHEWDISRRLLRQAGALGLLSAEIPEEYGGLGLDKVTATVITQEMARAGASFGLSYGVHTGISSLPLVYFGTSEQKRRYLPALVSGEWVGAYSLTEAGSGSDALAARTTARLSPDGRHYVLNGTKQWTTNGGFADLYVVYAQVDGAGFSSFLVERGFPGVSTGPEEKKMGYDGSSTVSVILDNVQVPVENLLHQAGKGHQVAFNTLNLGRFKLAPACLGGGITVLGLATRYAAERQQFGRSLSSFPLIQQKLADMAIRLYGLEATTYRLAALLEAAMGGLDLVGDTSATAPTALAEYAIECSIAKVLATETLSAIVDEAVQIHGGYGYMREFEVENAYRDSRVNRIFEGTNEINRLLIPGTLFRRGARGESPVTEGLALGRAALVGAASDAPATLPDAGRALFWAVAALALEQFPQGLEAEQEVQAVLADIAIETFALESALGRAAAATAADNRQATLHTDLADAFANDAFRRLAARVEGVLGYLQADDQMQQRCAALLQPAHTPVDRIGLGRRIAAAVVAADGWPL